MASKHSGRHDETTVVRSNTEQQTLLLDESTGEDVFALYKQVLDSGESQKEYVTVSKHVVSELPDRFEPTLLADIPEGAVKSYRDMEASTESLHIHEFSDHWELHVDAFNPHYYPVRHAVADASFTRYTSKQVSSLSLGTVRHVREIASDASRLSVLGTRTVGRQLFEATTAGVSRILSPLSN